jgi:hypothetical protein
LETENTKFGGKMAEDAVSLFHRRFPTVTFDISKISHTLGAEWSPGDMCAVSSKASPIPQGSPLYAKHGLPEFQYATGRQIICFTVVRIPKVTIPKARVVGTLRLGAFVRDTGVSMPVVLYGDIPLREEGDNMVSEPHEAVVTLPSSVHGRSPCMHLNAFAFVMIDGDRAVMSGRFSIMSWNNSRRLKNQSDPETKFAELLHLVTARKHDANFIDQMLSKARSRSMVHSEQPPRPLKKTSPPVDIYLPTTTITLPVIVRSVEPPPLETPMPEPTEEDEEIFKELPPVPEGSAESGAYDYNMDALFFSKHQ